MSDTLTLIADFKAKPGEGPRLLEALNAMVAPSQAEAGCRGYRVLTDPTDPDIMLCLEEWDDEEALQFHFGTPYFKHVSELFDEILVEPFKLRRLFGSDGGRAAQFLRSMCELDRFASGQPRFPTGRRSK